MNNIYECAKLYKTLLNKDFIFTLENGIVFKIFFNQDAFYHLIGLHKLKDIAQLKLSPNLVFKRILNENITQADIEKSQSYYLIADRIDNFHEIVNLLDIEKTKIIIDFDSSLIKSGTKLKKTKYILYRNIDIGYLNLTICNNKERFFPETFFLEQSKKYISEQKLLDIISIEVK